MTSNKNALIIAGTHSGCGKTTVTLGVMAALKQRGMNVQPFKCGPDFIDPSLHLLMTDQVSRNLDVRMCGADYVQDIFHTHAPLAGDPSNEGISIIEGVMGLFDGGQGSAATLARFLDIPVLLVVDVRSAAESVAAVVKGFEELDPQIKVAGVIFNRVGSERHMQMISDAVRKHCRAQIIGALPRDNTVSLPSRHLGLHMGTEVELNRQRLIKLMEKHLDLDLLLEIAQQPEPDAIQPKTAEPTPSSSPASSSSLGLGPTSSATTKVRLGVARDEAFCFYYQDNLDMLKKVGAELVIFSPLHDAGLPDSLDGLYLGGGYPELHAETLAANASIRAEIQDFSRSGKPVYAECGGFMYLTKAIVTAEEKQYSMVGVYPVVSRMQQGLRRLGYRQVEMQNTTILGSAGNHCYGHEFHYSAIDKMPEEIKRGYMLDDGRAEGYLIDNTLAGYVHLHWGKTPEAARYFVQMMGQMQE
ncbi:Cobyrinate a,c-diamide synthase [Candidatus Electrothrix laxa]